ncbi:MULTISPECIES: ParA family protein [Exiguobacterium]|uniref:ParA family protein n=1 Tax=Exiguobacterium TaxID=33986 RepID=UPI0006820368|nr:MULTISPECIES: AAA family ATPase [Exiguobacterium]ASI36874.1 hypothetical protein A0126_15165 [Exiguobacterium sp. N4-1P]ASI37647.1 hypothetical protein A0126_18845 [Exiguobacterium sp. N4-1P]KNH32442.1 hypothetical protein ACS74_14165 [Exiguobacterium acetylicum]RDB31905.1 hypothetical protein DVG79_15765 [Exiguobacterium sp. RIT594]
MSKQAIVINISNFKGGSGKSTTTVGVAHEVAKMGFKTLVVDFDPQADATAFLMPDLNLDENMTVFEAFQAGDLKLALYNVRENLDLIASDFDLVGLQLYLNKFRGLKARASVLHALIEPLREEYDFIFIDIPPTLSDNANNAFVASDFLVISLQTHGTSLRAAQKFLPYLAETITYFNEDLQIAGILSVIFTKGASSDTRVMKQAAEQFGDAMFDSTILYRERIKSWGEHGLLDEDGDRWDKDALKQYREFALELIGRINQFNSEEEVTS